VGIASLGACRGHVRALRHPHRPRQLGRPPAGAARFTWEYDNGRDRLLDLYQRGKDKQWDATKRIDWDLPVDAANVMGISEEFCPIYGSRQWEALSQAERDEPGTHLSSWLFSRFLHGEQGALMVAARIVESVPDMDSKFCAAGSSAPSPTWGSSTRPRPAWKR
jgi:hypothetical protein